MKDEVAGFADRHHGRIFGQCKGLSDVVGIFFFAACARVRRRHAMMNAMQIRRLVHWPVIFYLVRNATIKILKNADSTNRVPMLRTLLMAATVCSLLTIPTACKHSGMTCCRMACPIWKWRAMQHREGFPGC